MAQPKMDWRNLYEVLKHRDANPMITKTDLVAWAKRRFTRDEFIASPKFPTWIDGGSGNYLEREMHSILVGLVSLSRMADESQEYLDERDKALADREQAITDRDEARELAERYRGEAEHAKLELALMKPAPQQVGEGVGFAG